MVNSSVERYICLEANLPIIPMACAKKLRGGGGKARQAGKLDHSCNFATQLEKKQAYRLIRMDPFRMTQRSLHSSGRLTFDYVVSVRSRGTLIHSFNISPIFTTLDVTREITPS